MAGTFVVRYFGGVAHVVGVFVIAATGARAQDLPKLSGLTSEYSIGVLHGSGRKSETYPFGMNRQDFKFDNVAMFNTHTSVQVMTRLRAGMRTSFNLTDASSTDEHDFMPGCPLKPSGLNECVRHLPTRLDRAALFDLYGLANVVTSGGFKLDLVAGYKHNTLRWRTNGGSGEGIAGGSYLPAVATSYEQVLSAPYLGVGLSMQTGTLTVGGRIVGSAWAKAEDTYDRHTSAETITHGSMTARFVGADVGAMWRINSHLSLTADYRFERWTSEQGPTAQLSRATGIVSRPDRSGSIDTVTHLLSVGARIDLQPQTSDNRRQNDAGRPASWTGWSVGLYGGRQANRDGWTTTNVTAQGFVDGTTASRTHSGDGQRAGLFLGHTWQSGRWIWGAEADLGKSNASEWKHGIPGVFGANLIGASEDSTEIGAGWDGSLRVRFGTEVLPSIQVYATGGLAIGETHVRANCIGSLSNCALSNGYERFSATRIGWTGGIGYEWAYAGGWFTRGEYRYTSLGKIEHKFFDDGNGEDVSARIAPSNHRVTFGLGYRY